MHLEFLYKTKPSLIKVSWTCWFLCTIQIYMCAEKGATKLQKLHLYVKVWTDPAGGKFAFPNDFFL